MTALPSFMSGRLGSSYRDDSGRLVVPLHVTVRKRSLGFIRFAYRTGRERYPDAPRRKLLSAVLRAAFD